MRSRQGFVFGAYAVMTLVCGSLLQVCEAQGAQLRQAEEQVQLLQEQLQQVAKQTKEFQVRSQSRLVCGCKGG